jgi:tRNA A-37 threonylcarbamoyl transferase component Bud32/tetratricopeptide (TPR) repeat protein
MVRNTTAGSPLLLANRYRVIRRLGAGGMAAVYLAHDERLHRQVAVKRMHLADHDDIDARRFQREARLGASLSHANLVSIFDTEQDDESVLLVMEYVEGETLGDLLARGEVEPRRAIEIVRAVAEALDHAHDTGIVHRDIKPGNVLLGKDGSVKLADLGIAKAVERTDITGTGTVLGTPAYMAPEQLQGGKLGPAVDVYALATMAFEMLTGRKARRGRSAVEIAHQVVNEPPPDPRQANPAIPAPAADALQAGMAIDPAERPRSAGELAERLERAFGRSGAHRALTTRRMERARPVGEIHSPPPPPVRTARNMRWLPAAGLLAVALVAIGIAIASGGGEDDPATPARDAGNQAAKRDGGNAAVPATEAPEEEASSPAPEPEQPSGVPQPSGAGGPAEAERLHLEGHAALESGDYDTAIDLNTRAIEAFPAGTTWETDMNYAYALFSLGKALRLAGRPDEAIPVLEARLAVPDQTATVQEELDLARKQAG